MESEGVVALVMPRTGLTLALMSGTLLAPGALATPLSSSPNGDKTRAIVKKQTTSTSPTRPARPAPRSRPPSPPRRVRSQSPPKHSSDTSRHFSENYALRNVDARYITQLKSYFQKITSSSGVKNKILPTCSTYECPSLQERLHKHRRRHHSPGNGQHQNAGEDSQDFGNVSAPPSPQPRRSSLKSSDPQGTSAQTRLTFSDLGRMTVSTTGRRSRGQPLEAQRVQEHGQRNVRDNDFGQLNNNEGHNDGIKFLGGKREKQISDQNNNPNQSYNNNIQGSPGSNRRVSRNNHDKGNAKNDKRKGTRQTNQNTEQSNTNCAKSNQCCNTIPNNAKYSNNCSNTRPHSHQVIATDPENKIYNENYSQIASERNLNNNATPQIKNNIAESTNRFQENQNYQNDQEIIDNIINSNKEDHYLKCNHVDEFNAENNQITDYKYSIQDQVKNWLLKVPFYPTDNPGDLIIQENAVNELVDNITNLISAVDENGYEEQVAKEVHKCLDALHLWFPEDRRDQIKFKRDIRDQLLDKIFEVNKLYLKDQMIGEYTTYKPRAETSKSNNRYTYTVKSDEVCGCKGGKKSPKCMKNLKCDKICVTCNDDIENEIADWLNRVQLQKINDTGQVSKRIIADSLMQRLAPYFDRPSSENCKQVLTEEIKSILHDLNIGTSLVGNRKQYINRFAEDLANRLVGIHTRVESSGARRQKWSKNASYLVQSGLLRTTNNSVMIKTEDIRNNKSVTEIIDNFNTNSMTRSKGDNNKIQRNISDELRKELFEEVKDCLATTSHKNNISLGKDILDVLIDQIDSISNGKDEVAKTEITNLLQCSNDLTYDLVDKILDNILDVIIVANNNIVQVKSNGDEDLLTVYASEKELVKAGTSVTRKSLNDNINDFSTPHTQLSAHKPGDKENEINIETISKVIKAWLDDSSTKLHGFDEHLKEIMVYDLSGDIVDRVNQYGSQAILNGVFKAYIIKWLDKFKIVIKGRRSYIIEPLIKSLRDECQNNENHFNETGNIYSNNSTNYLQNKIVEWLNQQPPNIFKSKDINVIRNSIMELAQHIHTKLHKNNNDVAIQEEIAKWLLKLVKSEEKHIIATLSRSLSYKLRNHSKDSMIVASAEVIKTVESNNQNYTTLDYKQSSKGKKMSNTNKTGAGSQNTSEIESKSAQVSASTSQEEPQIDQNFDQDHDGTMMELVANYIQHNHDVDDATARNAFAELLIEELQNLSLSSRKEIYENLNTTPFSHGTLNVELQYLNDISDWLKNIPIKTSYNTIRNKKRVAFIIDLAKLLTEAAKKCIKNPATMELKMYIRDIVCYFINKLPIIEGQRENTDLIINQLVSKIESRRSLVKLMFINKVQENPPDVIEFIKTYIQSNSHEMTDDLKLEAWSARVIKEVKKLIYTASPESFSKTQVYDRLANCNERNDAVKHFIIELEFCKEISYWLNNLHLSYTNGTEKVRAVIELAKKMTELKTKSLDTDQDLREYITKWIDRLPLGPKQEIDIPTAVKQLINRMNLATSKSNHEQRNTFNKANASENKSSSKTYSKIQVNNENNESKNSKSGSQLFKNSALNRQQENINVLVTETQSNRSNMSAKVNSSGNSSRVIYDNQNHLQLQSNSTEATYNPSRLENLTSPATYGSNNNNTTEQLNQLNAAGNNSRMNRTSIPRTINNTNYINQSNASIVEQNQPSPGDVLLKTVEELCNKIPFKIITAQDQQKANEIKDDLVTIILRKISELNGDHKVNDDDALYGHVLDMELKRILSKKIPAGVPVDRSVLKVKLLERIKSIKQLLRGDDTHNDFRKDLLNVAAKVIGDPGQKSSTNKALFENVRNDVVDNFLEYEHEKRSEESRKIFKENIHHAITNYIKSVQKLQHVDTILKTNQIICELAKIPPPDDNTFKNEVIKVRMKSIIGDFIEDSFSNSSIDRKLEIDRIKQCLVKRLEQIDMSSSKNNNGEKIIQGEVKKTLKQIGVCTSQCLLQELTKNLKILMKEIQISRNLDCLDIPRTSRTTDTGDSGFASGSQFTPLQNVVYSNNMLFDQGYTQNNMANPGGYGGFDPLPTSTFQGGYQFGPDDAPVDLHDSNLSGRGCDPQCNTSTGILRNTTVNNGSRPGWQYDSAFTAGQNPGNLPDAIDDSKGYVISVPDTTISSNNEQNWQYTSGYGPGGNQNPGTVNSSIMNGDNVGSMPHITINTTNPEANWQYVSGYGSEGSKTPGSLLTSTNDTGINDMSRTYQENSFCVDCTNPYQFPNNDISRTYQGSSLGPDFNHDMSRTYQGSSLAPNYTNPNQFSNPGWQYSPTGQRFEYMSGYGQNGQMVVGSMPNNLNNAGDVNPCCIKDNYASQMQNSQMSRTYNSDEIFDPTANIPYQSYTYSPESADVSSRSDTRYQNLLEPLPTVTDPQKYSGVNAGFDNLDQSRTDPSFNHPGHGPPLRSTVRLQGPLDASLNGTGFNPDLQSTMVPGPMEGAIHNYSDVAPGYHSGLGPQSQYNQYQPYQGALHENANSFAQPVPVQAMPNYSENLVETWNSSASGAQAGVQEASALVHQSNRGVIPSFNGLIVHEDYRTGLNNLDAMYSEGFEPQANNYSQIQQPHDVTNAGYQRQYAYDSLPQEGISRTQYNRERGQNYNQSGFTERGQNECCQGGFAEDREGGGRSARKGEQSDHDPSSSADERDNQTSGDDASDVEECLCFLPRKCLVHCSRKRPPFCGTPCFRPMRCRRRCK